jgi:hypothetical protein
MSDSDNTIIESILKVRKMIDMLLTNILREEITNVMADIRMATHLGKSHFSRDHRLNKLKLEVEKLSQDYI